MAERPIRPVRNYAFQIRNHGAHASVGRGYVFGQPRPKFTYFMLFDIVREAKPSWHDEAVRSGLHVAAMKSFSHPTYEVETQTLNAYNAIRIIPTRIKHRAITAKFWDDSTSYIARLMSEYVKWYHYMGKATSVSDFGDKAGPQARGGSLPSIGLREKDTRHFFNTIKVYDLGTNPGAVNVYTFVHPVITGVEHGELDYMSTDHVDYTLTMQHEGFFSEIAQPLTKYPEVFTGLGIEQGQPTGFDAFQMGVVSTPLDGFDQDSQTAGVVGRLLGDSGDDIVSSVKVALDAIKIGVNAANSLQSPFAAVRSAVTDVRRVIDADNFRVSDAIRAGRNFVSTVERVAPIAFSAGRTIARAASTGLVASSAALRSIEDLEFDGDPIADLIGG